MPQLMSEGGEPSATATPGLLLLSYTTPRDAALHNYCPDERIPTSPTTSFQSFHFASSRRCRLMSTQPLRRIRWSAQSAKCNHKTAVEHQKLASTFGSRVDPWEILVISGQSKKASLSFTHKTLLASACISSAKENRSFSSHGWGQEILKQGHPTCQVSSSDVEVGPNDHDRYNRLGSSQSICK